MSGRRRDVQGLRALAVLLVIADHLAGWPSGGFVGVDVFFVISGFLITGLLLREHARTGRISFIGFYRRRVRRILPAALVVTLATVLVGSVVFARTRFEALLVDALWSTVFAANWRSVITGTDYLHAGDVVSPLQHFWSLAVEEQFYLVWPVVLLSALTVSVRRGRAAAASAIVSIGAASLAFSLWQTAAQPTAAYFSTFSRAWELAAGALLALAGERLAHIPGRLRPLLLWSGLAVIGTGAALIRADSAFPAPFAMVPVLGTMAVIASGTGANAEPRSPLQHRAVQYLGDASYSLYLWHFPVLVIASAYFAGMQRHLIAVSLALTAVLALVSHHWIERPVLARGPRTRLLKPISATALMVAFCMIGAQIAPPAPATAAPGPAVVRASAETALQARWREVDRAAAARTWPALTPSVDDVGVQDVAPEWRRGACAGLRDETAAERDARWRRCTFGRPGSTRTAVVVGDSISISWVPGLRAALEPLGYRVRVMSIEQCPSTDVEVNATDGSVLKRCGTAREDTLARLEALRPDLVVASETPMTIFRLHDGATDGAAASEWQAGEARTLARLAAAARRTVVLLAPPMRSGAPCAPRRSPPGACLLDRPYAYTAIADADRRAATLPGVEVVDTTSWFCSESGTCPSFVSSSPVLADGEHLTAAQSRALAPVLAEAVVRPGP